MSMARREQTGTVPVCLLGAHHTAQKLVLRISLHCGLSLSVLSYIPIIAPMSTSGTPQEFRQSSIDHQLTLSRMVLVEVDIRCMSMDTLSCSAQCQVVVSSAKDQLQSCSMVTDTIQPATMYEADLFLIEVVAS